MGKLVHWVERASFAKICRLLEILEQERHHEVLLTVKNLHDLRRHPLPHSVPIIPRPLPSKVVEGEHYKTLENSNFLKNDKMVISVKIRNYSRSRMMKQTSPLESSCEI